MTYYKTHTDMNNKHKNKLKTRLTSGSTFFMENADGKETSSNFTPTESSSLRTSTSFSTLTLLISGCKIIN